MLLIILLIFATKKKLNMGNNKLSEKIKVCKLFWRISDILLSGINPPEEIAVNDKLNESNNLKSTRVYKKITKIVDKK